MGAAQISQVKTTCGCEQSEVKKAEQLPGSDKKASKGSSGKMSDSEVLDSLKKALKDKFAKRSDAFDALGASDDGRCDKDELTTFLREELELGDNAERIFNLLDKDGNGYVDKTEFQNFGGVSGGGGGDKKRGSKAGGGGGGQPSLKEFKKFLKTKFKKPEAAFKGLDDDDSKEVTLEEFIQFLENAGWSGDIDPETLFKMLDLNKDGSLTYKELKKRLSAD